MGLGLGILLCLGLFATHDSTARVLLGFAAISTLLALAAYEINFLEGHIRSRHARRQTEILREIADLMRDRLPPTAEPPTHSQ
jgi:hypothetical protein